jgi:hypothetical protein
MRNLNEIEADLERVKAEIAASDARESEEESAIARMKEDLDRRIREAFAAEYAAIAGSEARLKELVREAKPAYARQRVLWEERKWAQMVPGARVTWAEPHGWRGTGRTSATVLQSTGKRVQIDLGGVRRDRIKWVSLESLSEVRS